MYIILIYKILIIKNINPLTYFNKRSFFLFLIKKILIFLFSFFFIINDYVTVQIL